MLRTQRAQRQRRQVHQPKLQHQCVLGDHRSATGAQRRNIDINSASIDRDRVFTVECAAIARALLRCSASHSMDDAGALCSFAKGNTCVRTPYGGEV